MSFMEIKKVAYFVINKCRLFILTLWGLNAGVDGFYVNC